MLDIFDRYIETEQIELSHFVRQNGIAKYEAAYRAFKFGLKNVFLTPQEISEKEDGGIRLLKVTDARSYCEIYKKHLPFFIALEVAQIQLEDWVVMSMSETSLFFLIKSSDSNHLGRVLTELKAAKEKAVEAGWAGSIYYKIIDAGGQNELK
jgi:hypothetical protein